MGAFKISNAQYTKSNENKIKSSKFHKINWEVEAPHSKIKITKNHIFGGIFIIM